MRRGERLNIESDGSLPPAPTPPPPAPPPPAPPPPDDPIEPPPPPVDVIDLPGYQSYFREVVSPTDRGMLAAAVFMDLVPSDYFQDDKLDIPIALVDPGFFLRQQIPLEFEPALYDLLNNPEVAEGLIIRAKGDFALDDLQYNPQLPEGAPIQTMADLYGRLLSMGSERYLEWGSGGQGPIDHDLDMILQAVNQFANVPEFANQPIQVREAFVESLKATLYDQEAFTAYGQALQLRMPGGGINPP